jgi:hypothetical protein
MLGTMRTHLLLATSAAVSLAALLTCGEAGAQIRSPGAHSQGPELEPHVLFRTYGVYGDGYGLGAGFRATFHIGRNNFIDSINNSVGVGVGLDWARYNYCYDYGRHYGGCGFGVNEFDIPLVLQWSFYFTKAWSAFLEPGLNFRFYSYSCNDPGCPNSHLGGNYVDPTIYVGARWHFSDSAALTLRLGSLNWSLGISFL